MLPPGEVRTLVRRNSYFDSVTLMRISTGLNARAGVTASVMMGTAANKQLLAAASLLTEDAEAAGPNDLIIAIRAGAEAIDALLAEAESGLSAISAEATVVEAGAPGTLVQAVAGLPGANLAMISTPGAYAAAEALKALSRGLHVFLFSDNVAREDEVMLKREAARRGLLVMGPDCGTAIINGAPLGFANAVRRGDIGLIGASGTGLQQVSSLIDRGGCGVSQVIGVGSHDLTQGVGSSTMLLALDALGRDPATRVIVLVSKPPEPGEAERVLERAAAVGKPIVVSFIGSSARIDAPSVHNAPTLEEAASLAVALSRGTPPEPPATPDPHPVAERIAPGRRYIRALYSGGTFAYEAEQLLAPVADAIESLAPGRPVSFPAGHLVLDLGADEFTVGRPHPMIDPGLRAELVRAAAVAPDTAVVLLDVVIGHGAAADPLDRLADAIREGSRAPGGGPAFVAFVCGTEADPQGLHRQEAALSSLGVVLAPNSTAAARLAGAIASARAEAAR